MLGLKNNSKMTPLEVLSEGKEFIAFWNSKLTNGEKNTEHDIYFWKSIASGYLFNELTLINDEDRLVSCTRIFPGVTKKIITDFLDNQELSLDNKLVVSIFSTMLPRHYYNFPHKVSIPNQVDPEILLHNESFVDNYVQSLAAFLEGDKISEKIFIKRYTILLTDTRIKKNLDFSEEIFTLKQFKDDFNLTLRPDTEDDAKISLESFLFHDYTKYLQDCTGLKTEEALSNFLEKNKVFKDKFVTIFEKTERANFNSIASKFIVEKHSPQGAFLLMVGDPSYLPNEIKQIPNLNHDEITKKNVCPFSLFKNNFSPNLIKFSIVDKNDVEVKDFYLIADINLISQTTSLQIVTSESHKHSNPDRYNYLKDIFQQIASYGLQLGSNVKSLLIERDIKFYCENIKKQYEKRGERIPNDEFTRKDYPNLAGKKISDLASHFKTLHWLSKNEDRLIDFWKDAEKIGYNGEIQTFAFLKRLSNLWEE